jgi:hypothetical protein
MRFLVICVSNPPHPPHPPQHNSGATSMLWRVWRVWRVAASNHENAFFFYFWLPRHSRTAALKYRRRPQPEIEIK